jgi:hypothetical protein
MSHHAHYGAENNFRGEGFTGLSLRSAETHVGLQVKCPLLLSDFNQNWNVPNIFSESPQ